MSKADTISRRIDRIMDTLAKQHMPRHWTLCLAEGESVPWIENQIDYAIDEVVIRRIDEDYLDRVGSWSYGWVSTNGVTYILWGDGHVSQAGVN